MTLQGEYAPSTSEWVRDQVAAFEASNGAEANTIKGRPIVVITTVGRKSGKLRKNPVMRVEHGGEYAAVGSKGGAPEDPEWVANFLAEPVVELQDGGVRRSYRARVVEGAERATWWERAVAAFPDYAEYQTRTDRQIPVFVLSPLD